MPDSALTDMVLRDAIATALKKSGSGTVAFRKGYSPTRDSTEPEPEEGGGLLSPLFSLLSGVGYVLDTPGALARGAIGNVGDLVSGRNKSPMRASGREMLESLGIVGENKNQGWVPDAGDLAGTAADFAVDPLNWIGAGMIGKLLAGRKTAKAAEKAAETVQKANAASEALRAMGAMPQEVVDKLSPEMLDSPGVPRTWYKGIRDPDPSLDLAGIEPIWDKAGRKGGDPYSKGVSFTLDRARASNVDASNLDLTDWQKLRNATDEHYKKWPGDVDEDEGGAVFKAFLNAQNPFVSGEKGVMESLVDQGLLQGPQYDAIREQQKIVAALPPEPSWADLAKQVAEGKNPVVASTVEKAKAKVPRKTKAQKEAERALEQQSLVKTIFGKSKADAKLEKAQEKITADSIALSNKPRSKMTPAEIAKVDRIVAENLEKNLSMHLRTVQGLAKKEAADIASGALKKAKAKGWQADVDRLTATLEGVKAENAAKYGVTTPEVPVVAPAKKAKKAPAAKKMTAKEIEDEDRMLVTEPELDDMGRPEKRSRKKYEVSPRNKLSFMLQNADQPWGEDLTNLLQSKGHDAHVRYPILPGPYDEAHAVWKGNADAARAEFDKHYPNQSYQDIGGPVVDVDPMYVTAPGSEIAMFDRDKIYKPYIAPRLQPVPEIPKAKGSLNPLLAAILGQNMLVQSQRLQPEGR